MGIDTSVYNQMQGKKKTISASKYTEKLKKLRTGQVKVSPGVESAYQEMYGKQPHPQVQENQVNQLMANTKTQEHGEGDFALHRNQTPAQIQEQFQPQPQQVQASVQTPSIKIGTVFGFTKGKGDIEISRDDQGMEYSFAGFELENMEFAKGDSVPSRLKRKFKTKQLYSIADVSIDLSEIADTFEVGDKLTFKVTEVKAFYQRHTSEELSQTLTVEAEIKTDMEVDIPAKIQIKAHPLAKDLLAWTMQELLVGAQVDEIIDIIDS